MVRRKGTGNEWIDANPAPCRPPGGTFRRDDSPAVGSRPRPGRAHDGRLAAPLGPGNAEERLRRGAERRRLARGHLLGNGRAGARRGGRTPCAGDRAWQPDRRAVGTLGRSRDPGARGADRRRSPGAAGRAVLPPARGAAEIALLRRQGAPGDGLRRRRGGLRAGARTRHLPRRAQGRERRRWRRCHGVLRHPEGRPRRGRRGGLRPGGAGHARQDPLHLGLHVRPQGRTPRPSGC